jgi:hypothetical protein
MLSFYKPASLKFAAQSLSRSDATPSAGKRRRNEKIIKLFLKRLF